MADAPSPDSGEASPAPRSAGDPALGRRFDGKAVLVTGASDRGIGGAIAERLALEGATLLLVSRREPQRLLKKLRRLGGSVHWRACDITRSDDVQAAAAAVVELYGRLDVLVNNAGVEMARPFEEFTDSEWRGILEVNLLGAIEMTRATLEHLLATKGVIVNIASALAFGGCPGFSIYSASKAGLVGLTQSLGWELGPRGVRVVGIAPGLVHTPMIHKHTAHLSLDLLHQIEACHPLGMGLPRDVAAAVAFVASADARWITGVTLPIGWAPHYSLPTAPFLAPPG